MKFKFINLIVIGFLGTNFSFAADSSANKPFCLTANEMSSASGNCEKQSLNVGAESVSVYSFSGGKPDEFVAATLPALPTGCCGFKIEIAVISADKAANPQSEDVYRVILSQNDPETKKETNILSGNPVRSKIPSEPFQIRTIELESCYAAIPNLPVNVKIERAANDPADTFKSPTALVNLKATPVKKAEEPLIVEGCKSYNSWPMMQALGGKLVCVYSRGTAHTISEGIRGSYVRTSDDGGKTWSPEILLTDDKKFGEVPIGKGLDENGDMLVWIRFSGKNGFHALYRTKDGTNFTLISKPKLKPMPMQITDVFSVPTVGLMAIWFTGNYGKDKLNSWGTLVSKDNGITWTQNVVESGLDHANWKTEPSAVYLGNGKILVIARTESTAKTTDRAQFQLESTDYGRTWKCSRTNIGDVHTSTPSLIFDKNTGLISNYYYERGRGMLKRRVVEAEKIFGNPLGWPSPEIIAFASADRHNAGNVNATEIKDSHFLAYYSGDGKNTAVVVSKAAAPSAEEYRKAK